MSKEGRIVVDIDQVRRQCASHVMQYVNEMIVPWKAIGFEEGELCAEWVSKGKSGKWIVYPKGTK